MLNAPRTGWWDQPSQSGRGYFFEVQGSTLFVAALICSSSGQPTWLTAAGTVNGDGGFSSTLTAWSTSQEPPVEIRRYRQTEIGWAGPAPDFPLPNSDVAGESATVNAASCQIGIAPGLIATMFGTGLTRGVNGIVQASTPDLPYSIDGTSVIVNGVPAPLYAIANVNGQEQINFQVP